MALGEYEVDDVVLIDDVAIVFSILILPEVFRIMYLNGNGNKSTSKNMPIKSLINYTNMLKEGLENPQYYYLLHLVKKLQFLFLYNFLKNSYIYIVMKSIQNNKIIIINLLKKFGVNKIKDLNYNIVTGGDLDSLRIMQFIIELQEKIKKKIGLSKLVIKKNQTIKGLLKIIK